MFYVVMSAAGLVIAFMIHVAYGVTLPDGSAGPYPLAVQLLVGIFAFGVPVLGPPMHFISTIVFGEDQAF